MLMKPYGIEKLLRSELYIFQIKYRRNHFFTQLILNVLKITATEVIRSATIFLLDGETINNFYWFFVETLRLFMSNFLVNLIITSSISHFKCIIGLDNESLHKLFHKLGKIFLLSWFLWVPLNLQMANIKRTRLISKLIEL